MTWTFKFPFLALAVLAAALLSSCGGGSGSDSSNPSIQQADSKRKAAATAVPPAPVLNGVWTQLPNPNYAPPAGPYARAWTEMTWDPLRGEMVIFGGNGATGYENDIWAYNADSTNWTQIDPQVSCPGNYGFSKPNGTDDANFKFDPVNRLYWVFGAASGYRCLSIAPVRTASEGSAPSLLVDPSLEPPASGTYAQWRVRSGSGDVAVVSYDDSSKSLTLASPIATLATGAGYQLYATTGAGIWYFDPASRLWTGQDTPGGRIGLTPTSIAARIAPAVAYSDADESFVMFAGKSNGSDKSVWRMDVRSKLWTQLPVPASGTPPHMRELLNSFVYDKVNNVFILFGGVCNYDGACADETRNGQTWAYHLPSNTWTNMNPPTAPSARAQHVMAYDEQHGVVTLFGGRTNGGTANDTWYYHFPSNTWTQVSTAAAPEGRYLSQIAYDPDRQRTVIFGGQASTMKSDIWALKLTSAVGVPSVTLTSPAAGNTYLAPASISLSADASDAGGSISKVEFFAGATKVGESTTAPYAITWSNVPAGTYSITAKATDNTGVSATSTAVGITVNAPANVAPSVSLTGPAGGSVFTAPASIMLTANAADSDGSVSKVEFYAGAVKIGESSSAPYSLSWSGVAAGSYTLTAKATDNSGASTTSIPVSITVNASANVPPSVSLTAPTSGTSYTSPASITLTATASDSDGSVSKVEFYAGAAKIGESSSAPHSFSWSGVAAGSYTLTARAIDNTGASATSSSVTVTVNDPVGGGTSINVALQVNGGVASASSTYSSLYTVASINDGNRRGNNWASGGGWNDASAATFPDWVQVNFSGAKTIDRIVVYTLADNYASAPEATASTTFSQYGITDFLVQYWNGSAWVAVPGGTVTGNNFVMRGFSFPAVTTDRIRITVNNALSWHSRIVELEAWTTGGAPANSAPAVNLTSPTPGTNYTAPASITLQASASDVDGTIAKVEFFSGGSKIGESSTAPYSYTWTGVTAGGYVLTAVATDNNGASTTSSAVTVVVNAPANVAPSVSLTGPAGGSVFTAPASIMLTANAADSDGSVSKVEFYAGAVKIGESSSAPYSLSWSGVAAGSYTLTAKATDNSGASTTSIPVSITVNASANVPPSVSLTAPTSGTSYTSPASITLTATASDSDGSVSKVEFYAGAAKIGESSSAPHSFSWSGVAAGSYTLTARAIDNTGASATSSSVTVTVNDPVGGGTSINVALQVNGGVASASSTYSSLYTVASINDGNRRGNNWASGGGWNDASAATFPDWVQVNFSGAKTIDRIVVYTLADNYASAPEATASTTFSQYGITDFLVQYWNGSAWVAVPGGTVTGNNFVMRGFSFPAVTTDRIRITVNNALSWHSRIVELEAWGN
ncbi:Ig-like domain-containing protein [Roseateles microcysteis]|uniref:Ig-like domain-containing protein n=1 Tax=Roseateles microcysteis TaxID=3119057 RepID=UPI002FE5638A